MNESNARERNLRIGWVAACLLAISCGGGQPQTASPGGGEVASADDERATERSAIATGESRSARVREPAPLPPIPKAPQPAPDALLAIGEVANPTVTLTGLAAYANAIQPGAGAPLGPDFLSMALGGALGGGTLDGINLSRPLRAMALNPQRVSSPIVIVVSVTDPAALERSLAGTDLRVQVHEGFAAIGTYEALEIGAGYALTTFTDRAAPRDLTFTLMVDRAMTQFGPMLQMLTAQMGSQDPATTAVVNGFMSFLGDIDELQVAVSFDKAEATGRVRVSSKQPSGFSAFIAQQRPSSFSLVGALPASPIVFAGRLDMSALIPMFRDLATVPDDDPDKHVTAKVTRQMFELYGLTTDEIAFSMLPPEQGDAFVTMAGKVSDAKRTRAALAAFVRTIADAAKANGKTQIKSRPNRLRHRGARLTEVAITPGPKATAEDKEQFRAMGGTLRGYLGLVGTNMLVSFGADANKRAKRAIEGLTSRRSQTLPAGLQKAISAATQRKESVIFAIDMAALAATKSGAPLNLSADAGMVIGMGFEPGAMTLRMSVPASQAAQANAQMNGGGAGTPPPPPPPPSPR